MTRRPAHRGTIVIATDRVLFPRARGTASRIIDLIRALRASGFRVVLVARLVGGRFAAWLPAFRANIPLLALADRVYWVRGESFTNGSPHAFDSAPYSRVLRRAVDREKPSAVMVHYIWMAPALDVVPAGITRIIDTLDLMHRRTEIYGSARTGAWVECTRDEETTLVRKADVILAIQDHERREFEVMAPDRRVVTVPHVLEIQCSEAPATDRVVAFVGSAIEGNIEGVERFLAESWPAIREAHPRAELRIYGEVCRRLGSMPEGAVKVGFVRELGPAYREADVVITPVTRGTGLKIKAVEAMAHCRPVVSTSCGASGLESAAGRGLFIEDDFQRFGTVVAELLGDRNARRAAGMAAGTFARENFSSPRALEPLLDILDGR